MSATDARQEHGALRVIRNQDEQTVTFAPGRPDDLSLPATEWLTADVTDVVDAREHR